MVWLVWLVCFLVVPVTTHADDTSILMAADLALEGRDCSKALSLVQKVSSAGQQDPTFWYTAGQVYACFSDIESLQTSLHWLEKYKDVVGNNPELLKNMAETQLRLESAQEKAAKKERDALRSQEIVGCQNRCDGLVDKDGKSLTEEGKKAYPDSNKDLEFFAQERKNLMKYDELVALCDDDYIMYRKSLEYSRDEWLKICIPDTRVTVAKEYKDKVAKVLKKMISACKSDCQRSK
jgi:hypothetical protein